MELSFRPATKDDTDRLLEIHLASYPDPRGIEERKRNLVSNAFGPLDDMVVGLRAGEIVARGFLFGLEAFFGGRAVKLGGVASVAVAPEARGQGVATALMHHLHVRSDVRGDAITMLYAFRHGWYAKLGYALTTSRKRLEIDPRSIPEAWRALARGRVRAATGEDREAIVRAYIRTASRGSSWLVRPDALWERLFARERRLHLVIPSHDQELAGYVAFDITQDAFHAPTTLTVQEIVADDEVVRHALLGALGSMRDQVTEIILEVAADDPIELALLDPDRHRFGSPEIEHALGTISGGPMVRIEDVGRAVEARGYSEKATFDLVVREEADEVAMSVAIDDGRAVVGAANGGGAIRTSRRGLAAILYGGLRLGDAVRLGWAEADARVRTRAEAALAMAPLLPIDPF